MPNKKTTKKKNQVANVRDLPKESKAKSDALKAESVRGGMRKAGGDPSKAGKEFLR